jgi:endonuclease III
VKSAPVAERARRVVTTLKRLYPGVRCALAYRNPFELYVATVLSAQCTDERVNQVTPELFARYPAAAALAAAPRAEIESLIRPTGFFRNKARSIQEGARRIAEAFAGVVPRTMEELLTVPGTGRKTANVILGCAFAIPGITVDTHVRRLATRLGWTRLEDPVKIEFELMEILPRRDWTPASLLLIQHGRRICTARKPRCPECAVLEWCPTGREMTRRPQSATPRPAPRAATARAAGAPRRGRPRSSGTARRGGDSAG